MAEMKRSLPLLLAALAAIAAGSGAQAQDAVRGKRLFLSCAYCHGPTGGGTGVGPSLKGVIGRKAAALPDFPYSAALKASGLTWTEADTTAFLVKPQAKVKDTRMAYPGTATETDAKDIVAYLATLKPAP
jgi:cytochrome c